MTIIVEDGTNVASSNSYVSVDDADAYFEDRTDDVWASASDAQKERALLKGADYLEQKYRLKWMGARANGSQSMDWPRRGVPVVDFFDPFYKQVNVPLAFQDTLYIAENAVPTEVKEAQYELARATMNSAGMSASLLQTTIGRATKREKVGSLEVEYFDGTQGSSRQTEIYWEAEQYIKIFLKQTSPHTASVLRS